MVNFGHDIIRDFEDAGIRAGDLIAFSSNIFATVSNALNAISYSGDDAIITYDSDNSVTILNIAPDSLTVDDFSII
ncbi:MAG: hypothetical protein MK137_01425 [Rickettsiales bacterium]|nr:hypothetical protein [Rickettsiales bacterium]